VLLIDLACPISASIRYDSLGYVPFLSCYRGLRDFKTAVQSMFNPLDYPVLVLVVSLSTFWLSTSIGRWLSKKTRNLSEDGHDDFQLVLGGTLTLLGLIIGFTFSMAVSRYDQRKNYEEQEANAIGTEYVRAGLLSAADAVKVRTMLSDYLDQRILNYTSRDSQQLQQIDLQTARLQTEMWSVVARAATLQPTPIMALAVSGMNDVLNSQGYSQAAWWNRVPIAAWSLLIVISIFCNLLIGYGAHGRSALLFLILPIALSIALFLIADIDSPRGGIIRVSPQNLHSLAGSLHSL
jgi:hypothetical protein